MLDYLKVAATDIVPELNTEPQIYFRQMDDTVGMVTNTLAYYLRSPALWRIASCYYHA